MNNRINRHADYRYRDIDSDEDIEEPQAVAYQPQTYNDK